MNNHILPLPNGDFQVVPLDDPEFLRNQRYRCWCHECHKDHTVNGIPYSATRMILCPECGNKRCPHATNHSHACTDSNEPGQIGSVYGIMSDPWDNWKPNREF